MTDKAMVKDFIDKFERIVIVQADNPDADSLGSALALEQILHDLGKEPYLYCGVEIPDYLKYLKGWDRVEKTLPKKFDASIMVDNCALNLLASLERSGQKPALASKPLLIIDHHETECTVSFITHSYKVPAVATGQLIYELARANKWKLSGEAGNLIASSILADSLGLTSEATSARSIYILAELVESGVSLAKLEQARRKFSHKTPQILKYKGELLQRIEYHYGGRIASVTIPWNEIQKYSHEYNPSMLVLEEMRSVKDVELAIVYKVYKDGRITAKIRSNYGHGVAGKLAEEFGGGGHSYASGFKITDGTDLETIKSKSVKIAIKLLDEHIKKHGHETL